uniref:DJ-1/PfpI domain-containing protein n=1 Tax=Plectus sambesii TaxID=2011161 RepID=A0A914XMG2_9BILA
SDKVGQILQAQYKAKKLIAAICGAPIVLNAHKIAPGCEVTSFPKVKDKMIKGGYKYSENNVVLCDNVLTSRGPGTAPEFALKIVELLVGEQKAREIKEELLFKF